MSVEGTRYVATGRSRDGTPFRIDWELTGRRGPAAYSGWNTHERARWEWEDMLVSLDPRDLLASRWTSSFIDFGGLAWLPLYSFVARDAVGELTLAITAAAS